MERVLYLEPDEEITSIIDRFKKLKAKKIALVVPRDAVVMQSVVNLKLLKREAENLRKELSLVTSDKVGRNLASQVGLATYDKLDQEFLRPEEEIELSDLEEIRDEKIEELGKDTSDEEMAKVEKSPFDKAEINKPEKLSSAPIAPEKPKKKSFMGLRPRLKLNKRLLVFGVIFSLFVVTFITFLFLPKAQINIRVKAEKINHNFEFIADKNLVDVDLEKKSIPATLVEKTSEKESTASATGEKEIGEKAKGTITIYNSYDSASQVLNAGTKLTRDGKVFLTTQKVTVPGFTLKQGNSVPGTANVSIEAEKQGASYNVSAGKFTISGFPSSQFYAQSSQALTGGFSEIVTVVSENDINTLKSNLTKELDLEIKKELIGQVEGETELLEEGILVTEVSFTTSANVDDQKSDFSGKLTLKAQALAYKKSDFENIANESFTQKISQLGKELAEVDYNNLKKEVKSTKLEQGQMTVVVSGEAFAAPQLDQKVLKSNLAGKDRIRAEEYLTGFIEIDSVKVDLWPFWVKKVPSLEESIKINIDYQVVRNEGTTTESDSNQAAESTNKEE